MYSSESVWFEQVDTAFKSFIQNLVKINDSKGTPASIPVQIRKPEEDFKVESYPSITLYNMYSVLDRSRMDTTPTVVHRDPITAPSPKVIIENSAIPYNLFYQLDFWSKYQTDMNEMTRMWLGNTGMDFNLPVLDASGKERSSYVLMTDNLVKSDLIQGNNRIFHSVLTYRVYVELDELIRTTKSMVADIKSTVSKNP